MTPRSKSVEIDSYQKNDSNFTKNKESVVVFSPNRTLREETALPECRFTWFDLFVITISMGTYLADIATDILVMLVYWNINENSWAALTLTFLIIPAVIMQIFSTRWYLADGHKLSFSLLLVHILMMGPMKRYITVIMLGFRARHTKQIQDYQDMYSQLSDVSMLRLFECFLESAPQLVLQLYIMIQVKEGDHILTGISACFSLLSLSWAIVAYNKALRAAVSKRKRVSWTGVTLQTLWRVGMVLGRITSIVLFATIYKDWILLVLGVHWLVMSAWVMAQDTDFCGSWWEEKLFNVVVGFIYVFCFFNMKEGKSRWRAVFYYTVVLAENSVMIILWLPQQTPGEWYNSVAPFAVWGGFLIGITSMLLYYKYFHPASIHRFHCCMPYYHAQHFCVSTFCCCQSFNETTNILSTPYKKGRQRSNNNDFDTSDSLSSNEELDVRDFTDLRCSYDTPVTGVTNSNITRNISKKRVCNKHKTNPNHKHYNNEDGLRNQPDDYKNKMLTVAVVGDAKIGFKVKSFEPKNTKVEDYELDETLMPKPRATSTPGDDLSSKRAPKRGENDRNISEERLTSIRESSEDLSVNFEYDNEKGIVYTPRTKLSKMLQTPKTHNPGSPSTLVKNWVKKNQEMYEENKDCFVESETPKKSIVIVEPDKFHENKTKRKYPQRMKSFSKKERSNQDVVVKRRKNNRKKNNKSIRNSFREAFGFQALDIDEIAEKMEKEETNKYNRRNWNEIDLDFDRKSAEKFTGVKVTENQSRNAIKSRQDLPPPLHNFENRINEKSKMKSPRILFYDESVSEIKRVSQKNPTSCESKYDNVNQSEIDEATVILQSKENTIPTQSSDENEIKHTQLYTMGKQDPQDFWKNSPARKKLAFSGKQRKDGIPKSRSIEPLGKSMEGVLESDENYRINMEKSSAPLMPRKILGSIGNQ